jgi:hypothetical protein
MNRPCIVPSCATTPAARALVPRHASHPLPTQSPQRERQRQRGRGSLLPAASWAVRVRTPLLRSWRRGPSPSPSNADSLSPTLSLSPTARRSLAGALPAACAPPSQRRLCTLRPPVARSGVGRHTWPSPCRYHTRSALALSSPRLRRPLALLISVRPSHCLPRAVRRSPAGARAGSEVACCLLTVSQS